MWATPHIYLFWLFWNLLDKCNVKSEPISMENTSQASRRFPAKTTKWRETSRPSWLVVIASSFERRETYWLVEIKELRNVFSIGKANRLAYSRWLASRSQEEIWFGKWFSMLSYISFIENTVLKTWNSFTIAFTLFTFSLSRDYFNSQVQSVSPYLGYTLNKILLTPFVQGTKFISYSGHAKVKFCSCVL